MTRPTSLIINGPFTAPARHWAENTRRLVAIPLVDDIRQRVAQWRADGWPGGGQ